MKCNACNGELKETENYNLYVCSKCGGLHGDAMPLGMSYNFVHPIFHQGESRDEDIQYFDFECVGSNGLTRRHGWYNTKTKCIVQVG